MIRLFVLFLQCWIIFVAMSKILVHTSQDTYENQYLSALQDSQKQLQQSLGQLTKQINSLNKTIQSVENIPSMKVVAFQQQISNQRDLLYKIQNNQYLPYSLKTYDCKNFTKEQISSLSQNIKSIQTDLLLYKKKLDKLSADPSCQVCKELMQQYNSTQMFLSKLKVIASTNCLAQTKIANISNYANVTNLGVINWIVGQNFTLEQYYMKNLNKTTQLNTTKCPLSTPFVLAGSNQCTNCTGQKPYFSLKTEKCIQCPQLTVFDLVTHGCTSCPIQTPIFQNGKCKQCPKGTIFNKKFHNCTCSSSYTYNSTTKNCICSLGLHDNGTQCIQCKQAQFWDAIKKKCLNCSDSQFLNKTLEKCVQIACQSNLIFNNLTKNCSCPTNLPNYNGSVCLKCSETMTWNSTAKKCQCPPSLPNYNGSSCVKCAQNMIWNLTVKKCIQLTNGTVNCTQNQIYNSTLKKCSCPQKTPFFDGKKCVSCYLPKYWNLDKLKCQQCPNGYKYDLVSKVCFQCPQQYPFSDGQNCVACYFPKYWDYSLRKCLACPYNTSYKPNKLKCQ